MRSMVALLFWLFACMGMRAIGQDALVAPGARLEVLGDRFKFTEGPAVDAQGAVFFTDVRASRIYKWSLDSKITLFRENTDGGNGLFFDARGVLHVCAGNAGRLMAISPDGALSVLADKYRGKRFNRPNDLWIDPQGGVYFSDPNYGRGEKTQDGEHVYYLKPDRSAVVRVIADMKRPNGVIGTQDGKILYVTDAGNRKIFRYTIAPDGTLTDKKLFAQSGCDGMTLDSRGNLYTAQDGVVVYNPEGKQVHKIAVPIRPTNVCFAGRDRNILFITARTHCYALRMAVKGAGEVKRSTGKKKG